MYSRTLNSRIKISRGPSNRQAFREHAKSIQPNMNLFFLLGEGENKEEIQNEASKHGDLIVGQFEDTYDNLPIKTLLGYQFYNDFCPTSNFPVAFVDDDTLVRFDR